MWGGVVKFHVSLWDNLGSIFFGGGGGEETGERMGDVGGIRRKKRRGRTSGGEQDPGCLSLPLLLVT